MQALIHFLSTPAEMHGILTHLQSTGSNATCIDRLAGSKNHLGLDERIDGFGSATHIRDLAYALHTISNQLLGILAVELVLSGAGQGDVALHLPRLLAGIEGGLWELLGIRGTNVIA